jgi:mRNA-degrading endonuclease RelE of RelBE toxin-antitoxin system
VKWALHIDREAMQALYSIPREDVPAITAALESLSLNPLPKSVQADEDDPSRYWIPVVEDFVIFYEIIDERHLLKIVGIE